MIANEVDLAIMGRPPADLDAEAVRFAPHPLVIVAAAGHPLLARTRLTLEDLAGETLIVRESGSGTRLAMEEFFADQASKPRIAMEMGSNEAIKQAVVAGLGISFISQHTRSRTVDRALGILKVEGTPVIRHWYLVRHKSKRLTHRRWALSGTSSATTRRTTSSDWPRHPGRGQRSFFLRFRRSPWWRAYTVAGATLCLPIRSRQPG